MMGQYQITKPLNNNVIICMHQEREVVLIGKGIGFNKRPGMVVDDETMIEKVYALEQKKQQEHYKALIEHADDSVIQAIIEAINMITNTDLEIDDNRLIVALTDHIIFAYKRLMQNQYINNPFAIETRHLYPEAYKIAASVIYKLNSVLSLQFPEDEVGFIALHIASNMEKLTMSEMNKINDLISKCIQIVEHDLHQSIDTTSVQYQRFIRHIQFLIRRLSIGETIKSQTEFEKMLKAHYPLCYNVAVKIMKMMQKQLGVTVYEAEVIYLTLHISHLTQR